MAKSDIILEDHYVRVKGELKVDNISSDTTNKPVNFNCPLQTKQVNVNSPSNKRLISISQKGIEMFDSSGSSGVGHFQRGGDLFVGGRGRIIAKDLHLSGKAQVEKIESSQVSLGGSGNGENAQNGKITMLNSRGQEVIIIDASSTAKIIVPGVGDLIDLVKKLQAKVAALERERRRP
jgi:hypothetical protein